MVSYSIGVLKRSPFLKRGLKVMFALIAIYFFVFPLIPGFNRALKDLSNVQPGLLVVGLALQAAALLSYSLLTHATLEEMGQHVSVMRMWRIQLSTRALGNIMPAGSAASSALGFRLLTMSGVSRPDAAFALATAGIGSAVILNFILWMGLIISIPIRGVNAIYGAAAIVGVILMAFAAFIAFGLMEGQGRSKRVVYRIATRFRFNGDNAVRTLEHLANRIESLLKERALLRRVVLWATLNWIFDALSLWVFIRAFGATLEPDALIVAFGIANILSVIPLTPGGLGIVEGVYIPMLVGFGLTRSTATVAVLSYRIAQYWLPIIVGWVCYVSLRLGPFSIDRRRKLKPLPVVAVTQAERGLSRAQWVEQFAPRDRTGQFTMPTLRPDDLEFTDDDTGGTPAP
jgi:putative heme transporter